MTSHVETLVSAPGWGARADARRARAIGRRRARLGPLRDLAPAAALLGLAALLWSGFLVGVAVPAARLHRLGEDAPAARRAAAAAPCPVPEPVQERSER